MKQVMRHDDKSFLEPIIPEVVEDEDEETSKPKEEEETEETAEATVGTFYKVLDLVMFPLMKRVL